MFYNNKKNLPKPVTLHISHFLARVRAYVPAMSVRLSVVRHDRARTTGRIYTKFRTYVYLPNLVDESEDGLHWSNG